MKITLKKILPDAICIVGILFATILFFGVACTQNQRVRTYGGTMTIELPVNQHLVNVTWKDNDIWVLTRNMEITEIPMEYTFAEKSNRRIFEGTIILKESKTIIATKK
jgi:hypothetical protein